MDSALPYAASFPAEPASVAQIRHVVAAIARECGADEVVLGDVRLAVSELATNVVLHAYGGARGEVRVEAEIHGGELHIVVTDDGCGMRPRPDSPGMGVGLPVVTTVANHVEIVSEGRGTAIHVAFPCPAAAAA